MSPATNDHHDPENRHHGHDGSWRGTFRYLRRFPSFWRSEVNTAVVQLVDPQPGETVVDIGAGMGPASVAAAKLVDKQGKVIAVEPTPFMRLVARSRALRRYRTLNGTAEDLPVDDASVDAAFAVNAMHHFGDVEQAVAEAARVLKPGGRLVFVDENFDDPEHPRYEEFKDRSHRHHRMEPVELDEIVALFDEEQWNETAGAHRRIANRPAKVIVATRAAGDGVRQ